MVKRRLKKRRFLGFVLSVFLFLGLLLAVVFFSLFLYYAKDLPRPEVFLERHLTQSTKIYDRAGTVLLYEVYGEEKRTWVSLDKIPENLKRAIIFTEDANFYSHFGVDPRGVVRAVLLDLQIGKPTFGGSTIPQQLIRSTFLSGEKTAQRKTREIILAIELDRRYSKDQMLEWYLNQIPFGQNAYGVEAASQTYFGKSVSEISLAEAATLAALIQSPYRLSPYGEEKNNLLERKNYVLDRMATEGFLTKEKAEETKKEEVKFAENRVEIKAPYFTLWVKQQLEEKYGEQFVTEEGLKVYTSLDWDYQQIAEEETKKGIENNKAYNAYNAGMVAINPKNGQILAMTVGSGDYYAPAFPEGCISGQTCLFDPKFNVVVGTRENPGRQPGSSFKPFVYVTAFEKGYNDTSTVIDEQTNFGIWGGKEYVPQNFDGRFRGEVTLRQSLAQSLNVPSIKVLLYFAGLNDSIKTAQDLGISTLKPPYGPAIVLGGWEVKLMEMTSAYSTFANDGLRVPPVSILKIEDSHGNIIEENKKSPERVLDSNAVRIINDILSDNEARTPIFGSRSNLYFENYQVAAKTGTTDDFRDGWALGYTPSITVGVWVGNSNNEPMLKKPAISSAGYIFHSFLVKVLTKYPKESFPKPEKSSLGNNPSD